MRDEPQTGEHRSHAGELRPDCGRSIALYADGTFYYHRQNGRACPGSHKEG